jgi:hypothetical protein
VLAAGYRRNFKIPKINVIPERGIIARAICRFGAGIEPGILP